MFKDLLTEGVENIHYLEHESIELFGYKIFGTPYIPPLTEWAFMLKGPERLAKWQQIPDTIDLLVTHTPPKGIMDGGHAGCEHLLNELPRINPLYHIFGHVHESYGRAELKGKEGN